MSVDHSGDSIMKRAASAASLIGTLLIGTASMAGNPAMATGLTDCPKSPNCVSSQASNPDRQVAPLKGGENAEQARERLTAVLDSLPRVSWTATTEQRIEAQFTSLIFRFTDDVVFEIEEDGTIQVRSASRIGYSDLGANRSRVEMLRERLASPEPVSAE
jgi:uncharacterized protein (DUF1499 family)